MTNDKESIKKEFYEKFVNTQVTEGTQWDEVSNNPILICHWIESKLSEKDKKIKALEGECIKILHDYMKSFKAKDEEIERLGFINNLLKR